MTKVKICGVTNAQDALWASNLGADFIGLNFYPQSPRKVSAKHAKVLANEIPPFVTVVGIFVDEPLNAIAQLVKNVPLKAVQLHGNETPEVCRQIKDLGVKVIRAWRLQGPLDLAALAPFKDTVDYLLFDHFNPEVPGGTGEGFDHAWLKDASSIGIPWFLSGGLRPENVKAAIEQTRPFGVDVCSGVEKSPTRKSFDAMKEFIQNSKGIR